MEEAYANSSQSSFDESSSARLGARRERPGTGAVGKRRQEGSFEADYRYTAGLCRMVDINCS